MGRFCRLEGLLCKRLGRKDIGGVTEIFKYILWVNCDKSKIALPASSGHHPEGTLPLRHNNIISISHIRGGA